MTRAVKLDPWQERAIPKASERYADLPPDLADASVAEAAARLGIDHVPSIDSDCSVYRGEALHDPLLEG